MIKLNTLDEAVEKINKIHGKHLSRTGGVNCYFSLRENNGEKKIFFINKGTKITQQTAIDPDSIIIEHVINKMSFGSKTSFNYETQIMLSGLRMINIYEAFTQYLTINRIDFMYVVNDKIKFTLLSSVDLLPPQQVLAQWTFDDEQTEDVFGDFGKEVILKRKKPRLNLDFS